MQTSSLAVAEKQRVYALYHAGNKSRPVFQLKIGQSHVWYVTIEYTVYMRLVLNFLLGFLSRY